MPTRAQKEMVKSSSALSRPTLMLVSCTPRYHTGAVSLPLKRSPMGLARARAAPRRAVKNGGTRMPVAGSSTDTTSVATALFAVVAGPTAHKTDATLSTSGDVESRRTRGTKN